MPEQVFRWNGQIPIRLMRIDVLGRLYAFKGQKNDEMVFSVVPKGGYRGSAKMLKALLAKHRWSQEEAAEKLHVSQSAISKYVTGKQTMLLRVALDAESLNTGVSFDDSWRKKHKAEKVFKLRKETHIALMRIEALGKVFGYYYHKEDDMVFRAVPKREYHKGKLLKEVRLKNGWSQQDVADLLGVSQSMVAKYESGDRVPSGRAAAEVRLLIGGATFEQIRQLRAYRLKSGKGKLLKDVREKNGWSQQDVADLLGVSQRMVARYESGEQVLSARAAFEVSLLIKGKAFEDIKRIREFVKELAHGKLLKELRAKNGWSQQDAARLLDVSQSMIARHESGEPSGRVASQLWQFIQKHLQNGDKLTPTLPANWAD